jgi:hypothetical protein
MPFSGCISAPSVPHTVIQQTEADLLISRGNAIVDQTTLKPGAAFSRALDAVLNDPSRRWTQSLANPRPTVYVRTPTMFVTIVKDSIVLGVTDANGASGQWISPLTDVQFNQLRLMADAESRLSTMPAR